MKFLRQLNEQTTNHTHYKPPLKKMRRERRSWKGSRKSFEGTQRVTRSLLRLAGGGEKVPLELLNGAGEEEKEEEKKKEKEEENEREEEKERRQRQTRRYTGILNRTFRKASDVTQKELDSVVLDPRVKKVYKGANLSTCHQCRQKTTDMKTICRSGVCRGMLGQFCGVCLRNRYGENAVEALKNDSWCCPVCRDVCNCSFCLPRRGLRCTGVMLYEAQAHGFNDVMHYLDHIKMVPLKDKIEEGGQQQEQAEESSATDRMKKKLPTKESPETSSPPDHVNVNM